ncbi:hypothetical protein KJ877_04190 [bacterium]|nr:hypothetical protein [bacterium]MBU1991007.1 hypothetical protein [bacterium]
MKKIIILLAFCASLLGSPPFTLDNLKNLRIYLINNTDYISKEQERLIKTLAKEKLQSVGIELDRVDASTFMIKMESIKIDKTYAISVQVAVGEEVMTHRKDKIQTLAFTYFMSDFMDSEEPYTDTLESVKFLLEAFVELYLEDME